MSAMRRFLEILPTVALTLLLTLLSVERVYSQESASDSLATGCDSLAVNSTAPELTSPSGDRDSLAVNSTASEADSLRSAIITARLASEEDMKNLERKIRLAQDTLPIKDRISERRKMRVITNYRFVAKGDIGAGFTVSYGRFGSEDSEFFSLIEDFSCDAWALSIKPFVSYFYKDNKCVGLKFTYTHIGVDIGSIDIYIDEDLNLTLYDTSCKYSLYSLSALHRSYVGLDHGHRFALFNETNLSYSWGSMDYGRFLREGERNTRTEIQELRLGLNPGLAVCVMNKFAVETSINIAGLKLRRERVTTDGERSGWRKTASMDYKFNVFNIQVGIVAYL